MEEASSNDPEVGTTEENQTCFHLFNCDKTFKFDSVEKLLRDIEEKVSFKVSVEKHDFNLRDMSEMCDSIKSGPQMDFAFFVVHAHESRLSINEENAGIGYAKIYKALLQKTDEKVIIVIGSDDNYKNAAEEQNSVLSRWAYRKVSSQFDEQFLDGRKSFIFSWDKEHRPIHEEAMLHFLDPAKKEKKFVPKPVPDVPVAAKAPQMDPKKEIESHQRSLVGETKSRSYKIQTVEEKPESKEAQTWGELGSFAVQDYSEMGETQPSGFEMVPRPDEGNLDDPHMQDTPDEYVVIKHEDVPKEDSCQYFQAMDTDASSPQENISPRENIAILYRDHSDLACITDLFGDVLPNIPTVTNNNPSHLKELLSSHSVKSCFIVVEAGKLKDEMNKTSNATLYEDLLKKARSTVETKVVIILCNDTDKVSRDEEDDITARIEGILDEKGIILWWKRKKLSPLQAKRPFFARSQSYPAYDGTAKKSATTGSSTETASPLNPEEYTLILKTRLRHGEISYTEQDVEKKVEGWTAPEKMARDLWVKWKSTADAGLQVFQENKTGNHRTVVTEGKDTQLNRLGDKVVDAFQTARDYLHSLPISSCRRSNTPPPKDDLGVEQNRTV